MNPIVKSLLEFNKSFEIPRLDTPGLGPDELIELLTWADSISYTEILVKTHIERARSALDIFADSKAKSALQAISDIVIDRFE